MIIYEGGEGKYYQSSFQLINDRPLYIYKNIQKYQYVYKIILIAKILNYSGVEPQCNNNSRSIRRNEVMIRRFRPNFPLHSDSQPKKSRKIRTIKKLKFDEAGHKSKCNLLLLGRIYFIYHELWYTHKFQKIVNMLKLCCRVQPHKLPSLLVWKVNFFSVGGRIFVSPRQLNIISIYCHGHRHRNPHHTLHHLLSAVKWECKVRVQRESAKWECKGRVQSGECKGRVQSESAKGECRVRVQRESAKWECKVRVQRESAKWECKGRVRSQSAIRNFYHELIIW